MIQFAVTITGINCNFLLNNKQYLSTPLWLKHTILDIHYKPYNVHEAHTCTKSAKKNTCNDISQNISRYIFKYNMKYNTVFLYIDILINMYNYFDIVVYIIVDIVYYLYL